MLIKKKSGLRAKKDLARVARRYILGVTSHCDIVVGAKFTVQFSGVAAQSNVNQRGYE